MVAHRAWLIALVSSALLSGCAGPGAVSGLGAAGVGAPPSAERPGTRVTLRNPDPAKWTFMRPRDPAQLKPTNGQVTRLWACRPLACGGAAVVAIQTAQSPTRHPDRKALEKMAKFMPAQARAQDIMMEAVSDGEDRMTPLSSTVTEVRGYPAIMSESKRTSKSKVTYNVRGDMFIGIMIVRVLSVSTDRADAKKNFEAFVTALEVLDVPPEEPVAGVPAPATLESMAVQVAQ